MPHFAFYQVLLDGSLPLPQFTTPGPGETLNQQLVNWKPPGDLQRDGTAAIRPVLCYWVDLDNANDFRLVVETRDMQGATRTIRDFTFDGNTTRQFMEPFPLEWVRTDQNQLIFRKESGVGSVTIRNVIVWSIRFREFG